MKYIEENKLQGKELIEIHHVLVNTAGAVASNLFFRQAVVEAETQKHRETLARSAYALIGICEAVVALVPEDEAERALSEVRRSFRPVRSDEVEESVRKLVKAITGEE